VTLLGVAIELLAVAALTLLLPGAVIEPICEGAPKRRGVAGVGCGVPSLVNGRPLFPNAEPGRAGGGIGLSGLKKLNLLLPLLTGDAGT
jgi:hypothetical protein